MNLSTRSALLKFIYLSISRRKDVFFLFVLSTTLTNLLSLTIPIVLMQTYDRTLKNGSMGTHSLLIIGGVVAVFLELIVKLAKENLINQYAAGYEIEKGTQLIDKILYGETKSINNKTVGSLIDSFNSVGKVKNLVSGKIINSLLDLPFVVIFLMLIAKLNLAIAAYLSTVFVLYIFIAIKHKRRFQHFSEAKSEIEEKKTSFFVDILSKITIVKSMTYEERLIRKHEYLERQNTDKNILIKSYDIVPDSLGVFVSQLVLFGILGVGSFFVIRNQMTIGVLTACVLLGNRIFQPVQGFVTFYFNLTGHQLAYRNIEDVLNVPDEDDKNLPDIPNEMDGSIQIRELELEEEGRTFSNISVNFESKKIYFIQSDNFNNATTLFKTILGRVNFNSGKILFDNYDSSGFNDFSIQKLIGYVPQKSDLFNGTVLENITMFESSKSQIALETASMIGLDETVAKMPQGFDTQITSRSSKVMPSGVILKIVLARVLLRHPKILILDNCYQSLDHESKMMMVWLINKLRGKMTVLFTAKYIPENLMVDNIFEIHQEGVKIREMERSA